MKNKELEIIKIFKKFLREKLSNGKELDIIMDKLDFSKVIYLTYSRFIAWREWEECFRPSSDFNYWKLHSELRDEETLILPQSKFRAFELRDGKFYSLISGLEYVGNLNDDCHLVKIDLFDFLKSKC